MDCVNEMEHDSSSNYVEKPYVGMKFDSVDDAKNYYIQYGRQEGFSIRVRNSSKSGWREKEVTTTKFVCTREGKVVHSGDKESGNSRVRRTSTIKCGCLAIMSIIRNKNTNNPTEWIVSKFNDDHNHKQVTPSKRVKMRANRTMPGAVKDLTVAFHRENLKVGKLPDVIGGAYIGFDKKDCYNHLRDVRHRNLEGGDAQTVLNYFRKKQSENPQFFYAVQVDEDGRAVNFFWVDHRARMAYDYFGDVVTFDTTYRTNMYDMPFAPFTGVNHHFHSIQFGCALLQDETETTFVWLFRTWLEAMGGRPPVAFITDQDKGMAAAIPQVFPNTRHRLCLWHIKKKFAEKLSQVYYRRSNFKRQMKTCLQRTYKVEDFEEKWKTLIAEHGLEDNDWLTHIYEIRASWVPVFNRGTFFAGMNTTGRNEGVNALFDDFVMYKTNLREFVVKYEQALKRIVRRENDEDYESEHKLRIVSDRDYLLKDAAMVYTRNMYNKFKDEFDQHHLFKVEEIEYLDGCHTYLLKRKEGEPEEFMVKFNFETQECKCDCQHFEFVGIICRHIIKVLTRHDIDKLPFHFILQRWTKGANKFRVLDLQGCVENDASEQNEALRLSHMCQQLTKLACEAAPSYEDYKIVMDCMNVACKRMADRKTMSSAASNDEVCETKECGSKNQPEVSRNAASTEQLLLDPNISQTKGRKKNGKGKQPASSTGRLKSGIEVSQNKKKRKCAECNGLGHDKRNCPTNPNRRKSGLPLSGTEEEEATSLGRDMETDEY